MRVVCATRSSRSKATCATTTTRCTARRKSRVQRRAAKPPSTANVSDHSSLSTAREILSVLQGDDGKMTASQETACFSVDCGCGVERTAQISLQLQLKLKNLLLPCFSFSTAPQGDKSFLGIHARATEGLHLRHLHARFYARREFAQPLARLAHCSRRACVSALRQGLPVQNRWVKLCKRS